MASDGLREGHPETGLQTEKSAGADAAVSVMQTHTYAISTRVSERRCGACTSLGCRRT